MKKELKQLEEALTQIQKYQMDEPDHEGEMAKSQMLKTMKYAADIMNTIDDSTNLPAWVQSKLTKIADYIGAVKHYMDSKTVRHIVTNMGEGVNRQSEEIRLVDMVPVNSRRKSVNEAKEVKVASRAGFIANNVFKDSYKKAGKQTSTLSFKFKKDEYRQNFIDDLKGAGVDEKDIKESVNETS